MEEKIAYIPLGSVVRLKDGVQKLLVISRAINVKHDGSTYFFDYGAVLYPDGLVGDQMVYFNHDSLDKVIFAGYEDEDNEVMLHNIWAYLENNPDVVKGDPKFWQTND